MNKIEQSQIQDALSFSVKMYEKAIKKGKSYNDINQFYLYLYYNNLEQGVCKLLHSMSEFLDYSKLTRTELYKIIDRNIPYALIYWCNTPASIIVNRYATVEDVLELLNFRLIILKKELEFIKKQSINL